MSEASELRRLSAMIEQRERDLAAVQARVARLEAALREITDPANWADEYPHENIWVNDNLDPFDVARAALEAQP